MWTIELNCGWELLSFSAFTHRRLQILRREILRRNKDAVACWALRRWCERALKEVRHSYSFLPSFIFTCRARPQSPPSALFLRIRDWFSILSKYGVVHRYGLGWVLINSASWWFHTLWSSLFLSWCWTHTQTDLHMVGSATTEPCTRRGLGRGGGGCVF